MFTCNVTAKIINCFSHTINVQQTTLKTSKQKHEKCLWIKVLLFTRIENIVGTREIAQNSNVFFYHNVFIRRLLQKVKVRIHKGNSERVELKGSIRSMKNCICLYTYYLSSVEALEAYNSNAYRIVNRLKGVVVLASAYRNGRSEFDSQS